ncbi:AMP-dependent synthetase/ligase [Penicillium atrosanguineum]|uniref:G/U mismatch-specific uracil DNA glycosylase n=1 Tax=Penicillium atrosanguineum TaxID=1132637 RepID=A0A9W9PQ64_9EURO|nr:AMP-dependent synthetase/ligase [Penicillium atrosanguineum]KAJ5125230.1 G/U mismatch-specific uracil DNA glycosylase [Penicillium atrosanguineum]KAJ5292355.1 AMP-dependent synthetase/ligase [Penicillium atrosanguineum]KAJ5303624.1 G/U mismatch-specific uracil DNA glycosylase [Penicillium atrosanguineum]
MHAFEACPEAHFEADEAVAGASSEPMPVERIASFGGALELQRFLHTDKDTSTITKASEPEPKVEKESPNSTHYKVTSNGSPGPIRSLRRRTRRTTTTSLTQTTPSTPTGNRIPARARSRDEQPPTVGNYLKDTVEPGLVLLLVGVNPGIMTGLTGFAYAHPTNLFWKLLYSSGITTRLHPPRDTYDLPRLYRVGNTNIVERPTRDAQMLSKQEMNDGVPILEAKIRENRPEAVCLVGKGIWEAVFRVKQGRPIRKEEFKYGWQDPWVMGEDSSWGGARLFVATTTSGLATSHTRAQKQEIWAELGLWVQERREAWHRDLKSHHES